MKIYVCKTFPCYGDCVIVMLTSSEDKAQEWLRAQARIDYAAIEEFILE